MNQSLAESVRKYWNDHIHDMSVVRHPVGTRGFFKDLEDYRFDKNGYLLNVVDFPAYKQNEVLEVGCGVGVDLVKFAEHGARVRGIDLSQPAIELAWKNVEVHGVKADLSIMDGTQLEFENDRFDVVYAHGVLPYTADVPKMISEIHRVLKPGGEAILQVYNRYSWLHLLSKIMNVKLEHEDAPVFQIHTLEEFRKMLRLFKKTQMFVERFPVKTRLHGGLKGVLYNTIFVGGFNTIPRPWVRRFGWHIIAKAVK